MHYLKIIFLTLLSINLMAADFTIEVNPAANSVDDSKVSSLSISKITNLQTSLDSKAESSVVASWLLLKADVASLADYVLKSDKKAVRVSRPAFQVTNGEWVKLTSLSGAAVTLDSSLVNLTNGRLIAPKTDRYKIKVVASSQGLGANAGVGYSVNDGPLVFLGQGSSNNTAYPVGSGDDILSLNQNDYINIHVYGNGSDGAAGGNTVISAFVVYFHTL